MLTLEEIQAVVFKLSREELSRFREWFLKYDSDAWDGKLEEDAKAGKLDYLADEAIRDFHAGQCTEL